MYQVLLLLDLLLQIYMWIIIAVVVMSWLIGFNIINGHNDIVRQIRYALYRLTEPVLGPIRRILPDLGAIDISPMVVLIAIWFIRLYLP
jgi:YggT family protein